MNTTNRPCETCINYHNNQEGLILDFEKCEDCIYLSSLKNNYKKKGVKNDNIRENY